MISQWVKITEDLTLLTPVGRESEGSIVPMRIKPISTDSLLCKNKREKVIVASGIGLLNVKELFSVKLENVCTKNDLIIISDLSI